MASSERVMNPVAMIIINPWKEYWKNVLAEPGIKPATSCSKVPTRLRGLTLDFMDPRSSNDLLSIMRYAKALTLLSKQKIFRVVQIESICRRQNKRGLKN